jgi:hypothetical protein
VTRAQNGTLAAAHADFTAVNIYPTVDWTL